jgi:hypothetical protein
VTGMRRVATITKLVRRQNTASGNPMWMVTLDDGFNYLTARDADVGFGISNSVYQDVPLIVTIEQGRITHVEVAP